jgi:ketosteroid isomerase-like protein
MPDGKALVTRLVDAANARDWEALLATCTPDVSVVHPLAEAPQQGLDGLRAFFEESIEALPDQYLHVATVIAEDDVVALEGRITATLDGETLSIPCAFFFTLGDDAIQEIRMYYDTAPTGDDEE